MDEERILQVLDVALDKYWLYRDLAQLYQRQHAVYTALYAVYQQQRQLIHSPYAPERAATLDQQRQQLLQELRQVQASIADLRQTYQVRLPARSDKQAKSLASDSRQREGS